VPGLALETFEVQAEAFLRARAWREHQFLNGFRPGRGLVSLYDTDFPDFTSLDLWNDVQAATPEDPRQLQRLSSLLAAANLEGRTREFCVGTTRTQATATVGFEQEDIQWRQARARWPLLGDVPRRHALEEGWRSIFRSDLNPVLERWHEALRGSLTPLGSEDWLAFWSQLCGYDPASLAKLSQTLLEQTAEIYGHGLGVYLGQLELPIDDAWISDVDWAFRAPRFDSVFAGQLHLPTMIRTLGDLGIELEEQDNIFIELAADAELTCLPLAIPSEIHVLWRPVGGWLDYGRVLRGLGMAEHLAHADGSLRVWERWLGDMTPNRGYGYVLEGLLRDRAWLAHRMEYTASDDFLIIAHLAWLYRARRSAVLAQYESRVWQSEPGTSLAAEYEEALSSATRVRHFPDTYLRLLTRSPWSALEAQLHVRAEVFAAQLRLFLKREFDEEWWRSSRAAKFIKDELWRPGLRHSAEELLGYMGYEGFDANVLVADFAEVLQPL
jgi:hypothetical protein